MLELKDGFVLYHGSYCEVKEPDLAKCAKRKDFGQGFFIFIRSCEERSATRARLDSVHADNAERFNAAASVRCPDASF